MLSATPAHRPSEAQPPFSLVGSFITSMRSRQLERWWRGKAPDQVRERKRILAADYSLDMVRHSWHAAQCLFSRLDENDLLLLAEAVGNDEYYKIVMAAACNPALIGTTSRMMFLTNLERFCLPLGFEKEAVLAVTLGDIVVSNYLLDCCLHLQRKKWFPEVRTEIMRAA